MTKGTKKTDGWRNCLFRQQWTDSEKGRSILSDFVFFEGKNADGGSRRNRNLTGTGKPPGKRMHSGLCDNICEVNRKIEISS